jgi:hypothetical protein
VRIKGEGKCKSSAPDELADAPVLRKNLPPGTYGVLAGLALPNTKQCGTDLLIVFVSTPLLGPQQFLLSCLAKLPNVQFPARSPVTLSDDLAPGEAASFDVYQVPFILHYPAAYFYALTPVNAPVSSLLNPANAIVAIVCQPKTDAAGKLTSVCAPF